MAKEKKLKKNLLDVRVTGVRKADMALPITNAAVPEDDFQGLYWDGVNGSCLAPPYNFNLLEKLVEENNAIAPCVSAYEVNIAGSGYILEKDGVEVTREDADLMTLGLFDFFDEVTPGMSLITVRKQLERTLEITGNAFIEVVRNMAKEIMFLNLLPTNMMRLLRLKKAIPVNRKIKRFGKELTTTMMVRERTYVQKVGTEFIYFTEFNASQEINKKTGQTGPQKFLDRGNEVIHLIVNKAANSPYGVPRWINQVPSVVGSRQAEELNLEFFASGGIPPVMVFISGGILQAEVRKQLENIFNASAKKSTRGAVVEVQPSSGSLDKENKPDVHVEKFGDSATKDSLFEKYDEKCEIRVRRAFRLPPLFVGSCTDFTYASVYASYIVAEAQVFAPERMEFDELFNATVMRTFDPTGQYVFRSKQISVKSIEAQLKGLGLLKGMSGVMEKSWVSAMNEVSGLDVVFDENLAEDDKTFRRGLLTDTVPSKVTKMYKNVIARLTDEFAKVTGIDPESISDEEAVMVMQQVQELSKEDKILFNKLFAMKLFPAGHIALDSSIELCSHLVDSENIG